MSVNYLPFSLVVDANIAKFTNFSAKKSFQTILVLAVSTEATKLEKVAGYSSYDDAVKDNATESVKAILAVIFGQENIPRAVKVAYVNKDNPIKDELDRITAIDAGWVFLGVADEVTESNIDISDEIAQWAVASKKIVGFIDTSVNALDKNASSLTQNISAKAYSRAFAVFGDTVEKANAMFSMLGYMATRNFDNEKSFYTAKFKSFSGVEPTSLSYAQYKQLTGFVEGQGLDKSVGNLGNVYTYLGDSAIFAEGNTGSGELLSVEHGMLWLEYTIQYEILNVFKNNDVVPYTDEGLGLILGAVIKSLNLGVKSGLLVENEYNISSEEILNVPESKRANHIAPLIKWNARLSGAIHYSGINGEVRY